MEIIVDKDRYGNMINRIEKVNTSIDVVERDNYTPFISEDVHYIINSDTYFHKEAHYRYDIFYYKVSELAYNEKRDLIRETTKNVHRQITKEVLCDYRYDEFGNKLYERIKTSIHNIDQKKEISVLYTYKNRYDDNGQLVEVMKYKEDGDIVSTKKYSYEDHKLDRIESYDAEDILYGVIRFYHKENGDYHEEIYFFGELSHYNEYTFLGDDKYRKTMINPAKGSHRWSLNSKYIYKGIIYIDIYEPILVENIFNEIMEYIIEGYGNKIQLIKIRKHDGINMDLFMEDIQRMFKDYSRYQIEICENPIEMEDYNKNSLDDGK